MGAKLTACCCHYYLFHSRDEKNAILRVRGSRAPRQPPVASGDSSDTETTDGENVFRPQSSREKLWSHKLGAAKPRAQGGNRPGESPTRQGLDRELQTFISLRDKTDKATEEWEKLNYDIYTLRYTRREVRSRWKKILLQLGYQNEVDALLAVNKHSRFSREQQHLSKGREQFQQLLQNTSLFPPESGQPSRYLYVMERLVSLDSAEDFVRLAKEKYPKKAG
ncbi:melanoregulin [Nelusetta ayraudi]|uniref:melanoregulin n=1 Tax=Nelusetta ayraudi TaxID=303726 RepID=UPI003F6FCD7F